MCFLLYLGNFYLVVDIEKSENLPKLWDDLQEYPLCLTQRVIRCTLVDFYSVGSPGCAEGLWLLFFYLYEIHCKATPEQRADGYCGL